MSQLSENIKYLRESSGTTQKAFAKAFGVNRDNIASYERGSNPKIEFLQRLVNFYHISMEDLVNSDLKSICEDDEKLDLKIRPKLDLKNRPKTTPNNNNEDTSTVNRTKPISNNMIYKFQLERIETLSAENALLKRENDELRAENARLKGNSGGYNKQTGTA